MHFCDAAAAFLIAIALSLVVSDGILRVLHEKRDKPREIAADLLLPPMTIDGDHDAVAPLPSHTKDVILGKRVVRYTTDADGNRVARSTKSPTLAPPPYFSRENRWPSDGACLTSRAFLPS